MEYHIVGLNPDDFPEIPKIEDVEFFEINSAIFGKMIDKTSIITGSSDDNRAHIVGIFAERIQAEKEKVFRLVQLMAADSQRRILYLIKTLNCRLGPIC